jgi:hypothetical protein
MLKEKLLKCFNGNTLTTAAETTKTRSEKVDNRLLPRRKKERN